jgi:hypothetical protein
MSFKDTHSRNNALLNTVTPLPIFTLSNLLQTAKAPSPKDITLSGMFISLSFEQNTKAYFPILVTP